jgi:hypothetical protein
MHGINYAKTGINYAKKFYNNVIGRQCYKTFFSITCTTIDATSANILRKHAKTGL